MKYWPIKLIWAMVKYLFSWSSVAVVPARRALAPARLAAVRLAVAQQALRPKGARRGAARRRAQPVAHRDRPRAHPHRAPAGHPGRRHEPRDGREHHRLHDPAARPRQDRREARVGRREAHVRHVPRRDDAEALVTGAAGFIGSHLSGLLLDGAWDAGGLTCCCVELVETGLVEEALCFSSDFSLAAPGCLSFLEVFPGSPATT